MLCKISIIILSGLIIFGAVVIYNNKKKNPSKNQKRGLFCLADARIKPKDTIPAEEKLVGNDSLKWENTEELTVFFYDGSDQLREEVLKIASEWSSHCGIRFKKVKYEALGLVRVAFLRGGGYRAAVGDIRNNKNYKLGPTVFLSRLDSLLSSDYEEFKRIVLHEFGHVLGLEHELQSPAAKIPWDTAAVYKYFKDHEKWTETTTYNNIFKRIPNLWYSDFDTNSIMIYGIPDTLTKNKSYHVDWPFELSEKDKFYIKSWYNN